MRPADEVKMDELKKLLRRLDGLDGSKGAESATQQAEAEQRGYVGALRGAPVHGDQDPPPALPPKERKTSVTAVYVAAAAAAAISTVTVYLVMSWQGAPADEGAGAMPSSERAVPSRLEFKPQEPGGSATRPSTDTAERLLQRADQLLAMGEIEAARGLLERAAELGSGPAALKLARSYDPRQAEALRYADSQTNPTLAKAWYERALALGTQEAASHISGPGTR